MRAHFMNVLHQIDELHRFTRPVVLAIGVFDGVHLGHQHVIAAAQQRARERGAEFVLMTFEPHPLRVLRPQTAPKRLCSPDHQLRLLERYGVAHVLLCAFDEAFAEFQSGLSRAASNRGWSSSSSANSAPSTQNDQVPVY